MKRFLALCLAIFLLTSFLPAYATAKASDGPKILMSSVSQSVNIGDVAQGPGALALIEKYIPNAQVKLVTAGSTEEIREMIQKRFPNLVVEIIRGKFGADANTTNQALLDACAWADYYVQASGPGVVVNNICGFVKHSGGKPYGILGVTYSGGKDVQEAINGADFCYFRDSVSLDKAIADGLTCPVMQFGPDTAFAFDIQNTEKAEAFMQANGLEAGKFMCLIPRYRTTPYWEVRNVEKNEEADKKNQAYKERDNAPLRAAAVQIAIETGMKIVVCPEDATQMKLGKEIIIDKLDEELAKCDNLTDAEKKEIKRKFVWHEAFWLPDEACALYAKSAGLFGNEMHSPIICIGNGIPATVGRWSGQTTKGFMWKDIGLSDWLFDMDKENEVLKIAPTVLEIAKNPEAAKAKQQAALAVVQGCQADMFNTLRYFMTGEGQIQNAHTSKIGGNADIGTPTGHFQYRGKWTQSSLVGAMPSHKLYYSKNPGAYAQWFLDFSEAAEVRIQVYRVPYTKRGVQTYEIYHSGKTDTASVDFSSAAGEDSAWVDLGTYDFSGGNEYVKLTVPTAEPATQLSEVRFIVNPGTPEEKAYWVVHSMDAKNNADNALSARLEVVLQRFLELREKVLQWI